MIGWKLNGNVVEPVIYDPGNVNQAYMAVVHCDGEGLVKWSRVILSAPGKVFTIGGLDGDVNGVYLAGVMCGLAALTTDGNNVMESFGSNSDHVCVYTLKIEKNGGQPQFIDHYEMLEEDGENPDLQVTGIAVMDDVGKEGFAISVYYQHGKINFSDTVKAGTSASGCVVAFQPDGTPEWARKFKEVEQSALVRATSITTNGRHIFVAGYHWEKVSIDGVIFNNVGHAYNGFVAKWNRGGTRKWASKIKMTNEGPNIFAGVRPTDLVHDGETDTLSLTGRFAGDLHFLGEVHSTESIFADNVFVAQFDASSGAKLNFVAPLTSLLVDQEYPLNIMSNTTGYGLAVSGDQVWVTGAFNCGAIKFGDDVFFFDEWNLDLENIPLHTVLDLFVFKYSF